MELSLHEAFIDLVADASETRAAPKAQAFESRFGKIIIHPDKMVAFPAGVLGMPEKQSFCVAHFPNDKVQYYKVLQCMHDPALAFIVRPVQQLDPVTMNLYTAADLRNAARDLGYSFAHLALLLIATVTRRDDQADITLNVRAPLMIDTRLLQGTQYVLGNEDYAVRQPVPSV
jgi:flagellar assembly factor FliW